MSDKKIKNIKAEITELANSLGFDICRFTKADLSPEIGNKLSDFVDLGRHGEMKWMAETLERRQTPTAMWSDAKSAIVLGMNYGPDTDPLEILKHKDKAAISVYAQNRDYHDIVKGRLKQIAQRIASKYSSQVKVFVDTAPLMEKPLAAKAGVGWQGKHTNLVSRDVGSWLFLGTILTDYTFEEDAPEIDHCGSCTSCIDICPTNAFPKPYQLDARKCISYLTIEYHGLIPVEFRSPMANRIYGCDDCLAICPWNKFAKEAEEAKLQARAELKSADLKSLITLDDSAFRKHFSGSPIKRIGLNRFLRNVLIAIGNSKDASLIAYAKPYLQSDDYILRGTALWALSMLLEQQEFEVLKSAFLAKEQNPEIKAEWT